MKRNGENSNYPLRTEEMLFINLEEFWCYLTLILQKCVGYKDFIDLNRLPAQCYCFGNLLLHK